MLWDQGKWGKMERILEREGGDRRTKGRFYMSVAQSVLFLGVRDMGGNPPSGEIPRGLPPPGGLEDGRHRLRTSTGWDMGVSTHRGGSGNGGIR